MNYGENLEDLIKMVQYNDSKNSITLRFNDEYRLFPFQTRSENRPKFDSGFKKIISEFSRINSSVDIDKDFDVDKLLKLILANEKIDVKNEADKIFLQTLLKDYLVDNSNDLKIVHPYLYQYVSKTKDKSHTGEILVASFFNDVMFQDIPEISSYFNKEKNNEKSNNNILTNMVIDNLPELNKVKIEKKYICKLPYVLDVFKEDMEFAFQHEDFLNKNIENIFAYYYFYYTSQLCLKLFDQDNTLDKNEEIYYLLESESASNNRKTVNNGYDMIKNYNKSLIYKIYSIDYVNKLLGTKGLLYSELLEYILNLDKKELSDFIKVYKEFIKLYNKTNDNYEELNEENFKDLFDYLYIKFLEIKDQSPNNRYAAYFEDVGKKYFLKQRGRYGYILNLTQDMLITITTLCVKEDKVKLKDLFKEYERRGIYFDNTSKYAVESLLNKLNYIDKKSDSGEAQYVRPIL